MLEQVYLPRENTAHTIYDMQELHAELKHSEFMNQTTYLDLSLLVLVYVAGSVELRSMGLLPQTFAEVHNAEW